MELAARRNENRSFLGTRDQPHSSSDVHAKMFDDVGALFRHLERVDEVFWEAKEIVPERPNFSKAGHPRKKKVFVFVKIIIDKISKKIQRLCNKKNHGVGDIAGFYSNQTPILDRAMSSSPSCVDVPVIVPVDRPPELDPGLQDLSSDSPDVEMGVGDVPKLSSEIAAPVPSYASLVSGTEVSRASAMIRAAPGDVVLA
ncbi:hypothetical protein LINGRAPRIM_LOCUS1943 [Linum grandiflorum]